MATNSFGHIFRITTWGESHGKAVGVVIDGCPAGLEIDEEEINTELALRAPGKSAYTSPRKESDRSEILSGVFEGKTTGAPISILIRNEDTDSSKYHPLKNQLRPGHANYTYLQKYGIFDYRGSGRSSARETVCRVAAGAIAKKILRQHKIFVVSYVVQIGHEQAEIPALDLSELRKSTYNDALFCPDFHSSTRMKKALEEALQAGDSLGGVIEFQANPPAGLGDPVYQKLEAQLASAMMSLPATKGFELGSGFRASSMKGSDHNDLYMVEEEKVKTRTNHAGGTLGGISTGMPLIGRVAFKPASSIRKEQETVNLEGHKETLKLPEGSKQDPCVVIRAVPIVEAMVALVLVDSLLYNRTVNLNL